eukprot:scaffold6562_cov163-Amphora_coffeaeformis.AAC.12
MKTFGVIYVLCGTCSLASAFVPDQLQRQRPLATTSTPPPGADQSVSSLFMQQLPQHLEDDDDQQTRSHNNDDSLRQGRPLIGKRQRVAQLWRRTRQHVLKPAIVGGLALFGSGIHNNNNAGGVSFSLRPPAAHASAPVMALPKAEGRDPASEAITEHERRMVTKAQNELRERDAQAREIERTQGEAARVRFEKEYQAQKEQEALERTQKIEQRQRDLLDEGIDPFTDLEGRRQIVLLEKGVDMGEVSGTPYYMEKEYERKSPQKSMKVKKAANRRMIACIVQDMKNRGVDPVEYFSKHQERTMAILDLPAGTAQQLAQEYQANLEQYGQITVPKEGEMSVKEKMAQAAADPKAAKEAAKKAKAEEKARLKAEREQAKAEAKAAKEEEKRLKLEEKERAKAEKEAAKAAAAAVVAVATSEAGSETAQGSMETISGENPTDTATGLEDEFGDEAGDEISQTEDITPVSPSSKGKSLLASVKSVPAAAGVVVLAGGGYAIKVYRDKQAAEEEERQRQFRLLMGEESDSSASPTPSLEEVEDAPKSAPAVEKKSPPVPTPAPVAAKRRLGIFKKKSERETDLSKLVTPDARASEFATLLAKTLTYGAPGRFPAVEDLPGGMPMDTFDLDLAKQLLVEARTKDDIQEEESAEIFANVVNCMLIDIVDLASTSLKEKEAKVTVDAINIVVEFMNHAASLYDSVAGDATIKPVVYEGTLSKSKLEQMYSAYAASGMMDMENLSDDFDSRVNLLQDVFQINEKKAEGLMMKAMQKQMMEMMKDPKGMEEMMKGMGGMEGLGDMAGLMGGNGEDLDTEQLMAMMRELKGAKDRGEISKEDLESVKSMFKETFGSGIEGIDESTLTDEDKEVLKVMKDILTD